MHRFGVGDRVRVRPANVAGNPRTPAYIRGKTGAVVRLHGRVPNPTDHRGLYPPLCTIEFDVADVFGRSDNETLCVDIHEDWLEAA